jgi:hypothetical protein
MIFNDKKTENGDDSHISTGNHLIDLLFRGEYYTHHLEKVRIGDSDLEKLFAMFVRDPRYGLKYRDYGRILMRQAGVSAENVALAGRYDDLWENPLSDELNMDWVNYLFEQCKAGNELAKKWMPHYQAKDKNGKPTKSTIMAAKFRRLLSMNKQTYGKFVKCDTVESKLSDHRNDDIDFSKLPSLALLKYWARFAGTSKNNPNTDMAERFQTYLDSVKKGENKMNMNTASVYDIYRNANKINADIAFAQIEKISGSWLPIVDTSGSMFWESSDDAISKALAVAHYLAKCSTYAPNKVVSFSSCPKLIELGVTPSSNLRYELPKENGTMYNREIRSMYTGDCSNTDFGAVMKRLSLLTSEFPDYLVVLTDGEFDNGGNAANQRVLDDWHRRGIRTKMVWWNFNARNITTPDVIRQGSDGSIFISGYNPQILKFLNCDFNAELFLSTLLSEYKKAISQD